MRFKPKDARCKAIATLSSIEEAKEVIKAFHGHKLPQLGGSRLALSLTLTVKLSVLTTLWLYIRPHIDHLESSFQSAGYLEIKPCPCLLGNGKLTSLLIISESAQRLAKAKSAVEKILAGHHTARSGQDIIWLEFLKREGLVYLKNLGKEHDVFVYCNASERLISLY